MKDGRKVGEEREREEETERKRREGKAPSHGK